MEHSLSETEFAVLGLLTFGERSGYDVHKLAGRSIGYFWRPAKSKIYAILPRLVERGLAESWAIDQTGLPAKRIYRITEQGRDALRSWLASEEQPPAIARDGLLLRLFFGAEATDPWALRAQILARKDRAEQQREELDEIQRSIDRDEDFFPYLTLLHGLEDARSTIAWADKAIGELDRRARTQRRHRVGGVNSA
jgi:DNA-binding PadR family transcriptional regulator